LSVLENHIDVKGFVGGLWIYVIRAIIELVKNLELTMGYMT